MKLSEIEEPLEVRDENRRRQKSSHWDECHLCGRGLSRAALGRRFYIEVTTDGILIPVGASDDLIAKTQGGFPVGPECAKRVPKEFRWRA